MKKLLLILLCLPMIGFGQDFGVVMGVSFNNSTGLLNPPEGNAENIIFESPGNYAESSSNITMTEGISIKHSISNIISINSKILYHISGYTRIIAKPNFESFEDLIDPQNGFVYPVSEDMNTKAKHKHSDHYITLPITIQYNYYGFFINAGGYCALLLKSEDYLFPQLDENTNKIDLGLTLGIGFNYELNYLWDVSFEVSSLYGLTDFYSTDFPLTDFYKRSYIGLLGIEYNLY